MSEQAGDSTRGGPRLTRRSAIQIAAVYLFVAIAWIGLSDHLLEIIATDRAQLTSWQTYKGVSFVAVTAGVIYLVTLLHVMRVERARQHQWAAQEQFRAAFEDGVVGMALLDPRGQFTRVNSVLCSLLGYEECELKGRHLLDIVHPADRARRAAHLRQCIEGPHCPPPQEFRYLAATGAERWVLVGSTAQRDGDGQVRFLISQVVDIAARREAEQRLSEQHTQLTHAARLTTAGQLAAEVAHELNQPLGAVHHYGETLLAMLANNRPLDRQLFHDAVQDIVSQADRAQQIVRRLRGYVASQPSEKRPLDLRELVHESLRLLEHEAARLGVRWHVEAAPDLPQVRAVAIEIQQVLVNLLENALHASADQAEGERVVTIRLADLGEGRVVVSVTDRGPGIDADAMMRLFDPFFTTKTGGLGLGLSISRSIIDAHRGTLDAVPRERGAELRFTLPVDGEGE